MDIASGMLTVEVHIERDGDRESGMKHYHRYEVEIFVSGAFTEAEIFPERRFVDLATRGRYHFLFLIEHTLHNFMGRRRKFKEKIVGKVVERDIPSGGKKELIFIREFLYVAESHIRVLDEKGCHQEFQKSWMQNIVGIHERYEFPPGMIQTLVASRGQTSV